jgi:hypothetical protein
LEFLQIIGLINNKYRDIVFKYRYSTNIHGSWGSWYEKTIRISVNDLNISGSEPVCYSPNKTYTVSGYPGSSTFNWSKSGNLTQVGGSTSSTYTVHALSSSTSGEGNVQVIVHNSTCNWTKTKTLWVGKPETPFNMICVPVPNCDACADDYIDMTASTHMNLSYTTFNWIVSGGTITQGQGTKEITVLAGSTPGNHFDKWVRTENACGVSSYYSDYGYIIDCGGGEFVADPNPADGYMDVDVDMDRILDQEISLEDVSVLRMFDKMGIIVYTAQTSEFPYRINTGNLAEGFYVIQMVNGMRSWAIQVIIEH